MTESEGDVVLSRPPRLLAVSEVSLEIPAPTSTGASVSRRPADSKMSRNISVHLLSVLWERGSMQSAVASLPPQCASAMVKPLCNVAFFSELMSG